MNIFNKTEVVAVVAAAAGAATDASDYTLLIYMPVFICPFTFPCK